MARIEAGSRLVTLRRERGLSQRALAAAAGVTRQAVGAVESGRMQPGVGIALGLARALGTTVEALFGTPEEPAAGARVAVGNVGGRVVTHPLAGDRLALEPGESLAPTAFVAGCDVAAGLLARHAAVRSHAAGALWLTMTNRAALDALARGAVHAAVIHGEVEGARLKRAGAVVRFEIGTTEEGWLVARGNPLGLRGAADLVRARARLVNRPAGAGARALLDAQLRRARVDPRRLAGYERELPGQLDAGRAVAQGFADAAVGLASLARLFDLDFIPLREERCSLLVPSACARSADVRGLIDALRSAAYRRDLAALGPYDTTRTGETTA